LLYDAVAALAHVHAHWWEAPSLGSTVGTWPTETALRTMVADFRAHLPGFFDDLGADLPLSDRRVLEEVFNSSLRPWLRLVDQRALTVIHGDAHTWNFLFPRSEPGTTYLIDWQLWHLDIGARDLAYMIAFHWDRAARQQLELPLLRFYHEALIGAGISSYSFENLFLDYRRCLVRNLTLPILFWSRGQRREYWRPRLDYALAAYRDLDCAELL
jgi:aminoglycoside phosphotransferase (APT) family kinase protein